MADRGCEHLNAITTVKHAKKRECEECVKTGDRWFTCARARSAAGRCVAITRRTGMPRGTRRRAVIQ